MNYVLLNWSYGYGSVPAIINKMKEPCFALAKKNNGTWWEYEDEESGDGKVWSKLTQQGLSYILSQKENHIINWGNHIFADDNLFDLNRPSAVALAGNKSESRRVLQNAGRAVPKTFFGDDVPPYLKEWFPIIARPPRHHGGKHFHIISDKEDFKSMWQQNTPDVKQWYFSAIFPKTNEYRLHVAHGKILAMYEKPLVPGEIRGNFSVNHESWRVLKWSEYNEYISRESIFAVETLGLDYGAVDVMYDAKNNAVAIAEVNTSPQTTWDYLSGKYAAYFDWAIRHEFPEHFAVAGTSVFYNKILKS